MTGVTVASELDGIDGDTPIYGEQTNEGGEVARYQCTNCGYEIPHAFDLDDLVYYLDTMQNLVVDGINEEGRFAGDGTKPPFVVFDKKEQKNIAGPFDTREEAEQHRQYIPSEGTWLNAEELAARLTKIDTAPIQYTICKHCDHFVEETTHMDDGEQEYDHDPCPGESHTLDKWKELRPDLFAKHADGKIGPNSRYHNRRGKIDTKQE